MTPAPRKPTPVATPWITRSAESGKSSIAIATRAAAPIASSAKVRSPAALPRSCRSRPIRYPRPAARATRPNSASCRLARIVGAYPARARGSFATLRPTDERGFDVERINHWIGGKLVPGTSGRSGPVFDPATGEQTHEVDLASAEE